MAASIYDPSIIKGTGIGTSLSVVIGETIFQNEIAAHQGTLAAVLPASLLSQLRGAGVGGSLNIVKTLSVAQQVVVKEVYTNILRTVWIFCTGIATLGLLCCIFFKKKVLSTTHTEHKKGLTVGKNQMERHFKNEKTRDRADLEAHVREFLARNSHSREGKGFRPK